LGHRAILPRMRRSRGEERPYTHRRPPLGAAFASVAVSWCARSQWAAG
jgi:hypothetical protein